MGGKDSSNVVTCDHECVNKENGMFIALVSGGVALLTTLIFASFAYTWSETGRQDTEKKEWRKEHQQVLDKKFEEVKDQQKELAKALDQNNDRIQEMLRTLLEEQRKMNQRRQQ